jgi:hypothetical protein
MKQPDLSGGTALLLSEIEHKHGLQVLACAFECFCLSEKQNYS